jgi:methyl-accepting chemotaxis protein
MKARRSLRWQLGLTAKLIIPFVTIFTLAIVLLATGFVRSQHDALLRSLERKSEMMVRNLAMVLADPFATPEYVQQILVSAKSTDSDVAYAVMMSPDGQALAATERTWAGRALIGSAFDAAALTLETFTRRETPTPGIFEVVMPVKSPQAQLGALRIGISTEQVRALARRAAWSTAVVGALILSVGVGIYYGLARRVVRPLNASVRRLTELASGQADLTLRLAVASTDEAGTLARSLNSFLDKQHQLVADIRSTSDRVGTTSQQISGAAHHLATTAQAQAAALEESAASLEEITATVKQTADNARHANQLALGARHTAEKGGRVVASAVASMRDITEASRRIGEIIAVIDDIAFQTNLLALNAAVEAARAGEQGRGFAVVAGEVRNLAQRSAAAAREIKTLIQDSVGRVRSGATLVEESGRTLEEIVGAVKQVTDIIAEIASASQEQSVGIDQVNRAVGQMDHVVQDNATQTDAVSTAAQALASDARELEDLVGRFRLRERAAADEGAAPWRPPYHRVAPHAATEDRQDALI